MEDHAEDLGGHIEDVPEHEELPVEEREKFTPKCGIEGFLRVAAVFFAGQLVSAIEDVVDNVHYEAEDLQADHEVYIVFVGHVVV